LVAQGLGFGSGGGHRWQARHGFVKGDDVFRGGGGLEAGEVTMEAEPHLLVERFIALELAMGLVDGQMVVDGNFVEALGFQGGLLLGLNATDAGQVALGMFEFGLQEFQRRHVVSSFRPEMRNGRRQGGALGRWFVVRVSF
jgi:hypothetical protein